MRRRRTRHTAAARKAERRPQEGCEEAQPKGDGRDADAGDGGRQLRGRAQPLAEGAAHGLEQIEFLVSAHKGVAPRPLAKVASGGELSRISLAIQTVASEIAQVPTLIFDEVDAGIGGRVAEIVGKMLKELGKAHQVMCVTHLPQVAASADHQWQVTKAAANGKVASRVTHARQQRTRRGNRAHAGRR